MPSVTGWTQHASACLEHRGAAGSGITDAKKLEQLAPAQNLIFRIRVQVQQVTAEKASHPLLSPSPPH
eukprot:1136386-Pelagomonas_calceolata.AAC.2